MKKAQGYEVIIWDCPYKKCGAENHSSVLKRFISEKYGAECSCCGKFVEIAMTNDFQYKK